MHIKPDGFFTEYELSEEENKHALANPLLLAYLHTKRAAYAEDFMTAQLAQGGTTGVDIQTSIIQLESQRAKLQILTELINETIEAQSQLEQAAPEAE